MPGIRALGAIRRARAATWYWFGIYFFSAVLLLEVALYAGSFFLPQIRDFALSYVFPEAWHPFVEGLVERLFEEQMQAIMAAAGMTLGVVVVGVCLFPIKEKLSASFEADAFPDLRKGREPSLIRQGIEELKLLGFYAVLQSVSIYLGLQGEAGLSLAGLVLGHWYLVVAMALDHAAPVFQRRGWKLLGIGYTLFRRAPWSLHLIGLVFVLPAVSLQMWVAGGLEPRLAIGLVVCAEVLGMAFATLAGCALGAELIAGGALDKRVPRWCVWGVSVTTALVLLWQGLFFAWWGAAVHHHSQILKCQYRVEWRRVEYQIRGRATSEGRLAVIELRAPVEVTNGTGFDLEIEDAQVVVRGEGEVLGRVRLPTFSAPSGEPTEVLADLVIEIPLERILGGLPVKLDRSVLDGLEVVLVLEPPLSRPIEIPVRSKAGG